MVDTPDIATIAALIGDRARAAMLASLMAGRALTATELARTAGVSKQTASSHLTKLVGAQLAAVERDGRHRYFRLAGHDVASVIEDLTRLAARTGALQPAPGPADEALRRARVCYDHLAGEFGVLLFDGLTQRGLLRARGRQVTLTEQGAHFFAEFGIEAAALESTRRPVCLPCLDWSTRRHHLAGALGAALLHRFHALGWARTQKGTRIIRFSAAGERALRARFAPR
jgi:DNA-binding transcriptional ArsR family regulator